MTSLRMRSNSIIARSSFAFLYHLSISALIPANTGSSHWRCMAFHTVSFPLSYFSFWSNSLLLIWPYFAFTFSFITLSITTVQSSLVFMYNALSSFIFTKFDSFNSIMFLMRLNNFSSFICWHRLVLEPWISSIDCYLAGHCTLTQCLPRHTQSNFILLVKM